MNPYENESVEERDRRMKWWREARFGLFIHWGVYAVPAGTYAGRRIEGIGEQIMLFGQIPVAVYKEYAKEFNPVKYDPDAWVRLAKEAGMKYIVITSKHHDGFALYDTEVSDWNVVDATPCGRDLLEPLAEACREHGMKLGFYYSQAQDWCHPGGAVSVGPWDPAQEGDMDEYIRRIAAPQVREILSNYGDIAVLWWDTPVGMTKERADMLLPLMKLQPGIIANNRLGHYEGDLKTPEQSIPATGLDFDWEACMTMNDTWGFKSYDDNWKSAETLIRNLVDIASKGGNYLLNVGPTAEGEIPEASVQRLWAVGSWMKVNGEAIYGTTASPFHRLSWGRCTKKEHEKGVTLYLHVFDWPSDGKLLAPGLRNEVSSARLLDGGVALGAASDDDGVVVELPASAPDAIASVVALEVVGQLEIDKVYPMADADGVISLAATVADINNPGYGPEARVEEYEGVPNVGYWTDPRVRLGFDFRADAPGTFDVRLDAAALEAGNRMAIQLDGADTGLEVEVPNTGAYWKFEIVEGGRISIDAPGVHTLALRPVREGWTAVNLRAVTLRPGLGVGRP